MCHSLPPSVLNVSGRTKSKNKEALFVTSKNSLQTNVEKTKYMFMHREQNAEQKHVVYLSDKSSESGTKSKLLGKTQANQNCILEEFNSRLTSGMVSTFSPESLVLQFAIKLYYILYIYR